MEYSKNTQDLVVYQLYIWRYKGYTDNPLYILGYKG